MIGVNTTRGWIVRTALAGLLGLGIGGSAYAIGATDFQGAISYDFRPPGARSLAMGGAFTALADDATASLANPAGLTQLRRPEFSFAAKTWTDATHLDWGAGVFADNRSRITTAQAPVQESRDFFSTSEGPSFISFAMPVKRFAFGIYHATLSRYSNNFTRDTISAGYGVHYYCLTYNSPPPPQTVCGDQNPNSPFYDYFDISTRLTIGQGSIRNERLGLSGAMKIGNRFSAGLSVYRGQMRYHSLSGRYGDGNAVGDNRALFFTDEKSDDSDLGFIGGLLYAGDVWRWGVQYNRGERYAMKVTFYNPPSGSFPRPADFDTNLRVPDRSNVGVAWRPAPLLTLSGDMEAIFWSQMTSGGVKSLDPTKDQGAYSIANAYNPHLGAEYVVLADTSPLSLRVGMWWEHGHRLKYTGKARDIHLLLSSFYDPSNDTTTNEYVDTPGTTLDNVFSLLFPGGGSQQHFTAGIGFVVGKLQFDAGYDYAKWNRQFALSTVYRF